MWRLKERAFSDNLKLESVRKAHWGIAEGTAAPDGDWEDSRRGAEALRGNGEVCLWG